MELGRTVNYRPQTPISICICTFKRPAMLAHAINNIISQLTNNLFAYEIVVVDNDFNRSAEETVQGIQLNAPIHINYDCEPQQNISLTRNRSIRNAKGDLIAFIDDDEFPEPNWLLELFTTYVRFNVDGVLGPVLPLLEGCPPKWLSKSDLCVRSSFPTGTPLTSLRYMRTGNLLFRKSILIDDEPAFDPQLGRSGGEDYDFFKRMLDRGHSFIWCDEARVFEHVPIERQTKNYYIKRAFLRGVTEAEQQALISFGTLKSLVAVLLYSLGLPVLWLVGQHLFIKYLIKDCDHIAKLLAHCGIKVLRERPF